MIKPHTLCHVLHLAENNKCALSVQLFWVRCICEGTAALVAHATSVLTKQEQGRCWHLKQENRASGMPHSGDMSPRVLASSGRFSGPGEVKTLGKMSARRFEAFQKRYFRLVGTQLITTQSCKQ